MKLYKILPPVCGEFGPETQINYETIPYTISNVHYIIDHWPNDLITSHPVFMASEALVREFVKQDCKGFSTEICHVSKSDRYLRNCEIRSELPNFFRLLINDANIKTDIFTKDFDLIVTEKVRTIINQFSCDDSVIKEVCMANGHS